MSDSVVPSLHKDFLKSLVGCKIIAVKRQIYWNDWNLPDFEQTGDGITELSFDNGEQLTVEHDTSLNVLIKPGAMPIYGDGKIFIFREVTDNDFWQARINQKIVQFAILHEPDPIVICEYPEEFGLQIDFENQISVVFLDAMAVDSEETDALVIAAKYDSFEYDRTII